MPIATTFALTHLNVFNGDTVLHDHALIIEEDTIIQIVAHADNPTLPKHQINGAGKLATSGFIDLQLNGCGGVLFNTDVSQKTLVQMNSTNVKHGTTQFLPTLITSLESQLHTAVELIEQLEQPEKIGILGLHLEGPFISYEKKGAHNADWIQSLTMSTAQYLANHHAAISVITLAPERTSQAAIDCLTAAGITVSLGHTNASYQQLTHKIGMTMATHLYNAMTPLNSREPGAVGYIFDHKPYTGIIVDGIHAAYPAVRIAHQQLDDRLFLVTDAVTPAGTKMHKYDMAGTPAFVTNGKCHYADGTIAGAALTMIEGINNLIQHVGLSQAEALRMATWYPAKAIGIDDSYGRLQPGYKANISLLNIAQNDKGAAMLTVESVYQMGIKRF